MKQVQVRRSGTPRSLPLPINSNSAVSQARFGIGDKVRHGLLGFRGVVFDVDPVFSNSDEWYEAIPEAMRPARDQPFYHLFADNGETAYIAYVSQQNLVRDETGEPIDHPAVAALFSEDRGTFYALDPSSWH